MLPKLPFVKAYTNSIVIPQGGGGGWGAHPILSDGDDLWGQKSKPKKVPRASKKTPKIPGPKLTP